MQLNSQNAGLVIIPSGGLISGDRVAAHPRTLGAARSGLLSVFPGEAVERSRPVHLIALPQAPEGVLAVGEDLAHALSILPSDRAQWTLQIGGITHLQADALTLEVTVEQQLDEIIEQLNRSDDLAGRLIWAPAAQANQTPFLEVNGKPFRVRELSPGTSSDNTIIEIGPQTQLKVFAPGYKSGIDIVILADGSGSMRYPDLTDYADDVPASGGWNILRKTQSGVRGLERMVALHRALNQLLETRLRVSGRMSRVALVAFTTSSSVRFPRGGGMAEIDENVSPAVIQEFSDAINLLQADPTAGTDIGQAIYYAAELLYRNGRPGNDRLIVLISDGANWRPKGQDAAGEMVQAMQEPVSLMEHLHREMKIHLHAIGISNREIFMRHWHRANPNKEPHPTLIPNHELLEQLVLVGGGEPTETGDTNVLQRYLIGLGAGVTRHIRSPRPSSPPALQAYEIDALASARKPAARTSTRAELQVELRELQAEIKSLRDACNGYTSGTVARLMFAQTDKLLDAFTRYMVTEVQNVEEFILFINNLNQCFCESVDRKMLKGEVKDEPPPIPLVTDILHGEKMDVISILRNNYMHDKVRALSEDDSSTISGSSRRDARKEHRKLVDVLQQLVGVRYIEDGDAELWSRLQRAVLIQLRDVLRQIRDEFKRAEQPSPATTEASEATGSDFVWKW
jgi:Mg-chelatase subunit ChlD